MKAVFYASLAALTLTPLAATAQTTTSNSVSSETKVNGDGVATTTTTEKAVSTHQTRRPKKVLGVKIGRKTVKHQTVRKTKVSSNGDASTTVKSN